MKKKQQYRGMEGQDVRLNLINKLRNILFTKKAIAPLLALAFAGGSFALGEEIPFDPSQDITIGEYQTLTLTNQFEQSDNDPTKTISLNDGGTFNYLGTTELHLGATTDSVKQWKFGTIGNLGTIINVENEDTHVSIWNNDQKEEYNVIKQGAGSLTLYGYSYNCLYMDNSTVEDYSSTGKLAIQSKEKNTCCTINDLYAYQGVMTIDNNTILTGKNSGALTIDCTDFALGYNNDQAKLSIDCTANIRNFSEFYNYGTTEFKNTLTISGGSNFFAYNYIEDDTGKHTQSQTIFSDINISGDKFNIDNVDYIVKSTIFLLGKSNFLGKKISENEFEKNTVTLNDYSYLYVGENNDFSNAKFVFNGIDDSEGSIFPTVFGGTDSLNTNIDFNGEGNLYLTNQIDDDWIKGSGAEYNMNPVYITKDEFDNSTELVYNNLRKILNTNQSESISGKNWSSEFNHSITSKDTEGKKGNIFIATYTTNKEPLTTLANGAAYNTVRFNDSGENQSLFNNYGGNLLVKTGTVAIMNNTVFGNGNGTLDIYGGEYTRVDYTEKEKAKVKYGVLSNGTFALYRDDITAAAPTISMSQIVFKDINSNIGTEENPEWHVYGSTFWMNTNLNGDNTSERLLGTLEGKNRILFGKETNIWYDCVSTLDKNANMVLNLKSDKIAIVGVDLTSSTDKNDLAALFEKPLVSANVNDLFNAEGTVEGLTITANAKNVADFAAEEGMTDAEQKFATRMDSNRVKDNANVQFNDALYNETDTNKVRQTIRNLARSTVVSPQTTGHMGNPTSIFFGGGVSGMSGSMTRGQSMEQDVKEKVATDNTTQSVFAENNAGNSQPGLMESAWVSFSHTSVDGDSYLDQGILYDSYRVSRTGLLGGLRRQFNETTSGGILFAYSSPEVRQSGDYEGWNAGYSSGMDMEDFQFALHFEKILLENWEASVFIGGGTQSMDWNRSVFDREQPGSVYNYTSSGTGNTLTATAYLSRKVKMTENWTLRPTIGIDSEHSWLFDFTEQDNSAAGEARAILAETARAYHYDTMQYSRNTARVGLTSVLSLADRGGLTGRVFYGVQLGGEDSPEIALTALDANGNWGGTPDWLCNSNAMGRESLNLGAGGFLYLNPSKTLTANGDYNALMYKNAVTQNVTAGIQWRY